MRTRRDVRGEANLEAEFVVVGSGAGGGPLACRLARAGHTVILLEAGPAEVPLTSRVPAFHGIAAEDPAISWEYFVRHFDDPALQERDSKFVKGKGVYYPRAAAVGGCTTHNALITVVPHDSDWNGIASLTGDASWGADEMRRYFSRLEHCEYVARPGAAAPTKPAQLLSWLLGRLAATLRRIGKGEKPIGNGHGFSGWLHTNRAEPWLVARDLQLVKLIARTVWQAIKEETGGTLERFSQDFFDPNAAGLEDVDEGFTLVPIATRNGCRNGPREFIEETVQLVPNRLHLVTDALATKVLFDKLGPDGRPRAVGVEYLEGPRLYRADPCPSEDAGRRQRVGATREVIVAAGAFNTPQLLMLSGVGPKEELDRHGIDVVADLPGVGRNLQDRYEVAVVHRFEEPFELTRDLSFKLPPPTGPREQAWLDWECAEGPYTTNGVVVGMIRRSRDELPEPDLFVFGVPADFRGYYPRYSDDAFKERDRFTWAVLKAHTSNRGGVVSLRSKDPRETPDITFRCFEEGTGDPTADLDAVVDGVKFVRRAMSGWTDAVEELVPGSDIVSDDDLRAFVRHEAWGHHASCSCPIGADGDPHAVLDSRLRVRGIDGLRVVDASIFPEIPGFFIVTAIYMASEKAADMIIADHASPATVARRAAATTQRAAKSAGRRARARVAGG